ncbi:hypothetical protein N431DRAFT_448764 [Stipitochalara longipes BDJ]|nr:hypothetical protein N431DRAFT_448764 [Stipitochalara longipes BDJ]
MCCRFILGYLCGHIGQPEYKTCGAPSCTDVDSLVGFSEYLEFCPECFLTDDFRELLQQPWTPVVNMIMQNIPHLPLVRDRAQGLYDRVANSQEACLTMNDSPALIPNEGTSFDWTRVLIVHNVIEALMRVFWARLKYEDTYHPTLYERMLILKLHKIIDFNLINNKLGADSLKISQLPQGLVTIVPEEKVAETDYCHICREQFGTRDEDGKTEYCVKTIACNHTFGNWCLAEWLHDNDTCPTCRGHLAPRASPKQPAQDPGRVRLRFNVGHYQDVKIDKAGTPQWMIALLGATEVAEDQDNVFNDRHELLYLE